MLGNKSNKVNPSKPNNVEAAEVIRVVQLNASRNANDLRSNQFFIFNIGIILGITVMK